MKIFVDEKPYDCRKCLFGLSKINCSILLKSLNIKSYGIEPLDECPLRSIEDIEIKAKIKHGYYSDDKLEISLILDGKEFTSDEVVYKDYVGSEDD